MQGKEPMRNTQRVLSMIAALATVLGVLLLSANTSRATSITFTVNSTADTGETPTSTAGPGAIQGDVTATASSRPRTLTRSYATAPAFPARTLPTVRPSARTVFAT
jgi:hypothetical protein